jgi:[ribosomal protein S5]-alanine N-acetyltransferase
MAAPILRTSRLILRPYSDDDIPELISLIGAREVAATTLRIPHPYTLADAKDQVRRSQGSEDAVRLGVWIESSSVFIGGVGLRLELDHNRAELGYWIGVPYWGNGYATEASQALLEYGFGELNLVRIYASHTTNNPASGNVLRKLGMKYEGCQRKHILKWGEYLDLELYALLKDEARLDPAELRHRPFSHI